MSAATSTPPAPPPISVRETKIMPISAVHCHARNVHQGDVAAIAASLREHGQYRSIVVSLRTGNILAGNHTYLALQSVGATEVLCDLVDVDDIAERRILLNDNRTAALGHDDMEALAAELEAIRSETGTLDGTAWTNEEVDRLLDELRKAGTGGDDERDRDETEGTGDKGGPTLADRFGVPPFSVLDARQGYWQERKRRWLALGIRSEIGRGESGDGAHTQAAPVGAGGLAEQVAPRKRGGPRPGGKGSSSPADASGRRYAGGDAWRGKAQSFNSNDRLRALQTSGDSTKTEDVGGTGTSIFDPVLCEIAYRWFSPERGRVLDPFAGGSVRGIVAAKLGRPYLGIELRGEQVDANRQQSAEIMGGDMTATWVQGDSLETLSTLEGMFDLVFSCPPYADLEVYSDDPADLSAMAYPAFRKAYAEIIRLACEHLRDNRFAVWVVGDVRDKRGVYRNLVAHTIEAFEAAGLAYYNEAILVTSVGSLPVRAGRIFQQSRKLGKGHQQCLVFYKGDPRKIGKHFPPIEVSDVLPDEATDGAEAEPTPAGEALLS